MPTLTYHRDESVGFSQLDFAATRVLDTEELASRWRPWFSLADGPRVPLRAHNALYLARMLTGEDPPEPSTWFSIVSVTSARYQVVRQARASEYLCSRPEELRDHLRTPRWRELVARSANWSATSPQERVLVIALLTQLGFHRHITTLLGTLRPTEDEVEQRLVYETCRALHQLNRRSPVPLDAFTYLAENAARPALGIQAALQLVSALARDRRDHEAAGRCLAVAEGALPRLDREPDWLAHLVRSRYHRAAALHHLMGRRDVESCDRHMTAALAEDDALALLADGPVRRHYQQENRQLVLEAYLKLDTLTGNRSAPADAAETLIALDPVDPEPRHAIGAWHAANSRWEPAYESFMEAARSGTFRGASAASAAAQCLVRMGRHAEARVAYELSVDLDPAAIIPLRRRHDALSRANGHRVRTGQPSRPPRPVATARRRGRPARPPRAVPVGGAGRVPRPVLEPGRLPRDRHAGPAARPAAVVGAQPRARRAPCLAVVDAGGQGKPKPATVVLPGTRSRPGNRQGAGTAGQQHQAAPPAARRRDAGVRLGRRGRAGGPAARRTAGARPAVRCLRQPLPVVGTGGGVRPAPGRP